MISTTSKQLVRALFERKQVSRCPFIPVISSFAAKLAQLSVQQLLTNPTKLANTLQSAQRLFGYDAIVAVFDPTIEAEACGCEIAWLASDRLPSVVGYPLSAGGIPADLDLDNFYKRGRMPVALEATKRLAMVAGRDVGLVGVATGPLTLASHLRGPTFLDEFEAGLTGADDVFAAAGKVFKTVCQLYCDLKVDAVLVCGDTLAEVSRSALRRVSEFYISAANIVRFYNAAFVLCPGSAPNQSQQEQLRDLGLDAIVHEWNAHDAMTLTSEFGAVGAGLVPSVITEAKEQIGNVLRGYLQTWSQRGMFLSTSGEVAWNTPPENLHEIMRVLRQVPLVEHS